MTKTSTLFATMQQDILLHFWVIFYIKSGWNMKKKIFCPVLEFFHCLPLWKTVLFALELFHCLPLWTTVRVHGKKLQNATKKIIVLACSIRGCQIGMQGPQLCAKPRHFCKLDVATSRIAFLDLNLHVLQVATSNSKNWGRSVVQNCTSDTP